MSEPPRKEISINEIIGIYVAIAAISIPPTKERTQILANLETVILSYTNGFQTS